MPRCTSYTSVHRRCKNAASKHGLCGAHFNAIERIKAKRDANHVEKLCGHTCSLWLDTCCECTDTRPHNTLYTRYMDTIGDIAIGTRYDGYCPACKTRCTTNASIENAITAAKLKPEIKNLIQQLARLYESL